MIWFGFVKIINNCASSRLAFELIKPVDKAFYLFTEESVTVSNLAMRRFVIEGLIDIVWLD